MVRLNVDNIGYVHFSSYTINLKYNAIASTFQFNVLNPILDNLFGYPRCEIIKDDFPILTGTILVPELKATNKPELSQINGYSVPGILEDMVIPVDLYPLQSDNLNLDDIAKKYCQPFDVNIAATQNVAADMRKKYVKVVAEESQTIKSFINQLANERGIILTHNELGSLLFTRINTSILTPVADFTDNDEGLNAMTLSINGQQLHSEITIIRQASVNNPDAGQATISNPYCPIYRPKTIISNNSDIFDLQKAVRKALSDELTAIQLTINTTKFVKPGNLITVKSDKLRLAKRTQFFVEETEIQGNVKDERYTLKCVLPDIYTDTPVTNIFNQ